MNRTLTAMVLASLLLVPRQSKADVVVTDVDPRVVAFAAVAVAYGGIWTGEHLFKAVDNFDHHTIHRFNGKVAKALHLKKSKKTK